MPSASIRSVAPLHPPTSRARASAPTRSATRRQDAAAPVILSEPGGRVEGQSSATRRVERMEVIFTFGAIG